MRTLCRLAASLAAVLVGALPAVAQADPLGSAGLGRPYWHVFIAYAIAIGLVGGWAVSIARRLARIERRLPEGE